MSCIFTLTTTSTPSSRRSPRAARASSACRCSAPARCRCRARCRASSACSSTTTPTRATRPRHVYLGEARTLRARPRGGAVGRRDGHRVLRSASARIPVYPAADGYALPDDVALLASNESPDPPLPAVVEAVAARARGAQPLPRPVQRAAAPRAERPLRRARRRGSRSATGRATSCWPRARRCSSPGAELVYAWPSFCVYPHLAAASGARAIACRSTTTRRHDLDAMAREITVATRLVIVCNPNNPTSTALPLDEIAAFVARGPAPRRRDPRRGLLRVQHARRPRRVDRAARAAPEPRPAAHVLEGLRAVRRCASASRCAAPRTFVTAVDQVRQPFFCNAAAQAAAIEALRHQDAVAERVERAIVARVELESGLRRARASSPPSRRRTSAGSTCRDGARVEAEVVAALRRARRARARGHARSGRDGALRVTYGTPAAERALPVAALGRAAVAPRRPLYIERDAPEARTTSPTPPSGFLSLLRLRGVLAI